MSDLTGQLLRIQDLDEQLAKIDRELRDIPSRRKAIESRLEQHVRELAQREEAVQKEGARIREREGEVEAIQEKIARLRQQQYEIKSNTEYAILEGEIEAARRKISEVEDLELAAMERHAALGRDAEAQRVALREEEALVRQDIEAMETRVRELETEREQARAQRTHLAAAVDPDRLARYERIMRHVGRAALAPVEQGACGGCHMQLPPQVINDAAKPDALPLCDFCSRLLYRR